MEEEKVTYKLEVPLDASGIEGFKPDQGVKVLVIGRNIKVQPKSVILDENGKGLASFSFPEEPGALRVIVGPETATDEELQGLQTITVNVSARRFINGELKLAPVKITPYYWWWWLRWCREFIIRGRVLCSDGRPVPGANVCAYDLDSWWWWCSKQQVGCATTGVNGSFEIKFKWCCGWWPWWWWKKRVWQIEPYLAERIVPVLRESIKGPIPLPDPVPDLAIFKKLLGEEEIVTLNIPHKIAPPLRNMPREEITVAQPSRLLIEPTILDRLRDSLLKKIPSLPELERLHIWPWWPWHPWWDCTPDIIFRVTQDCKEPGNVIVDEGFSDTRWNIPTTLDVTLVANEKACCLQDGLQDGDDDHPGTCVVLTDVCDNPIKNIGGNLGALPTPEGLEGYLNPGAVSDYGDRPYGGTVIIQGQVGNDVDYYAFEYSDDGGTNWHDMPIDAVGDIVRPYIDTSVWPPIFHNVSFLNKIEGQQVYESRQHYEATHNPLSWGSTRWWMAEHYSSLMHWLTQTPFMNGTYHLRVKGWKLVNGHLVNPIILPVCATANEGRLVLRIDNRLEGLGSGHPPSVPDHPCGPGTVHTCTMEPDTDFLSVKIIHADGTETNVSACGNVPINDTDFLQVDFFAYDPEGHLAYYTMQSTYGKSKARNFFDPVQCPSTTLESLGGAPVPAAKQVGPRYSDARVAVPPAVAPVWRGGAIRLKVKAKEAFPETCGYQLELRAHKRTIVNCDHTLWNHTNYSEFTISITVSSAL